MKNNRQLWLAVLIAAVVTLLRIGFLADHPLYADEAQYWFWAKNPDWGYYSKPPMVGWAIAATTYFCGDGEACARLASPLAYFITSLIIFAIGKRLFDAKTALLASVIFITMPGVSLSSMLVATDPFLLLFWAAAIYFYMTRNTIGTGVSAGLGLLSKYNFAMFAPSVLLDSFWQNKNLELLRQKWIYIAAALALIIFLPNIWWNHSNDWVSFRHTEDISQISEKAAWNPASAFEFIGTQAAMLNPILMLVVLWVMFRKAEFRQRPEIKTLLSFILPLLVLILALSFRTRAHGNWAAPIHVPLALLVAAAVTEYCGRKTTSLALALNVIIMATILFFDPLAAMFKIPPRIDPYHRQRGWEEAGTRVGDVLAEQNKENGKKVTLLTDRRKITAELLYYARPESADAQQWNFYEIPRDHFALHSDMEKRTGDDFLLVMPPPVNADIVKYFESAEFIKTIKVEPYIELDVWLLKGYKGESK